MNTIVLCAALGVLLASTTKAIENDDLSRIHSDVPNGLHPRVARADEDTRGRHPIIDKFTNKVPSHPQMPSYRPEMPNYRPEMPNYHSEMPNYRPEVPTLKPDMVNHPYRPIYKPSSN